MVRADRFAIPINSSTHPAASSNPSSSPARLVMARHRSRTAETGRVIGLGALWNISDLLHLQSGVWEPEDSRQTAGMPGDTQVAQLRRHLIFHIVNSPAPQK